MQTTDFKIIIIIIIINNFSHAELPFRPYTVSCFDHNLLGCDNAGNEGNRFPRNVVPIYQITRHRIEENIVALSDVTQERGRVVVT
jgi:hypothetical protein